MSELMLLKYPGSRASRSEGHRGNLSVQLSSVIYPGSLRNSLLGDVDIQARVGVLDGNVLIARLQRTVACRSGLGYEIGALNATRRPETLKE